MFAEKTLSVSKNFGLSTQEINVVELICKGYANQRIADDLYISLSTVKNHIQNINKKLGTRDRKSLISKFV